MSNLNSTFKENYDLASDIFSFIIWTILKIIIGKLAIILCILLVAIISIASFMAIQKKTEVEQKNQVYVQASGFNSEGLPQDRLTIGNQSFGLPLNKSILKPIELKLLTSIRLAEWSTRQENKLDGDRDSIGAYQQRVSELIGDGYLAKKTKEILGNDVYQSVFDSKRIQMIKIFKDTQLRNNTHQFTQGYLANPQNYRDACGAGHKGVDLGYQIGDLVVSSEAGEVQNTIFDSQGGGNVVVIKHKNRYTLYAHLSEFKVSKGDKVRAGQVIALSGNTGGSTGPHLHYQIMNSLDKGWNCDTASPINEPYLLSSQTSPFLALSLELTQIHLQTGLFDFLALERIKKEAGTASLLNNPNATDQAIIQSACQSQRPIEFVNGACIQAGWIQRASIWIGKL